VRRNGEKNNWKYVVTFDADGQLSIDNIGLFIDSFENNPDLDIVF
jgi:hypothetical protein